MRPRYHIGLSATPFRNDKMTKALYRLIGPMLHKVDRKNLENIGAILIPDIKLVRTNFLYNFANDYSKMLSALTTNEARNALIADGIVTEFQTHKEPIMVVSDRVAHCDALFERINGRGGIRAVVVSSKMNKTARSAAIDGVRSGKYNVLIATINLLGEGFDAPNLNALFLTTPVKFSGRLTQIIGRILRPSSAGGKPRVYDYRDTGIPVLRYSGFARDTVYKKFGWM